MLLAIQGDGGPLRGLPVIPTASQALWLSADSGVTGTSTVTAWADRSANTNNASASGAGRPALTTNVLNGQPGITFDGSANFMSGASNVVTAGSDRHVFVVCKGTASVDANGVYFDFRKAAADMYLAMGISGTPYAAGDGVAVNSTLSNAGGVRNWTSNQFQLNEITRVSNTALLWVNGTSIPLTGGTSFASDNGTSGYLIGARAGGTIQFFKGVICEIIVYSAVQAGADLTAIKAYVTAKYGLVIA